jgi:hypothetical protein
MLRFIRKTRENAACEFDKFHVYHHTRATIIMLGINEVYLYDIEDTTGQNWVDVDSNFNLILTNKKPSHQLCLIYASDYYNAPCYYIFSYYSKKFFETNGLDRPITATGIGPNLTSFQLRFESSGSEVWTTDNNPLIWKIEGGYIVGGNSSHDAAFNFVSSAT